MKRGMLLLGAVALAGSAFAETEWQDVTSQYLKNPSMTTPYWNGGCTDVNEYGAESWSAQMALIQAVNVPAGKYTLTANAFYRYGAGEFAELETVNNLNAFIFLGTSDDRYAATTPVMSLYNYGTENVPASMAEGAEAFKGGKYLNTVEFNHPGGDLYLGIINPVYYWDEWCMCNNFKLTGPNGEVEIPNGDFSQGLLNFTDCGWDNVNIGNSVKFPDNIRVPASNALVEGGEFASDYETKGDFNQWNADVVATFRKAGGSAYNHGQLVSLPAGTYRFGSQSFIRYGNGNQKGWWVAFKNGFNWETREYEIEEGESAFNYFEDGFVDPEWPAYLYATNGWDLDDKDNKIKPLSEEAALDPDFGNPEGFYTEVEIKNLFEEEAIGGKYPDNNGYPNTADSDAYKIFVNSGFETLGIEYLLKNPKAYRNYVEFTLTEPQDVWVGIKKDVNAPGGYWHEYREFTLEQAVSGAGVTSIEQDYNAPVEYYTINGLKVNKPGKGLYIVKQGSKVSKQILK